MSEKPDKIQEFRTRFGNALTRRHDPAAIERRRQHVWEMAMEGIPNTTMGDILNVSRQTIASDIDYLEKLERNKTQKMKKDPSYADMDIGVTCKKLQTIAEESMMRARTCDPEAHQDFDRYLNTAQRALMNYAKIRVETGVWPKAGVEIRGVVEHELSFADKFGKDSKFKILDDSTSRRKVMSFIENTLKVSLNQAALELNAIPVEATISDAPLLPAPVELTPVASAPIAPERAQP